MSKVTKDNRNATQSQSAALRAYWAGIKQCVAQPDGSAQIIHADGTVEHIAGDGRRFAVSRQHKILVGRFNFNKERPARLAAAA